MPYATQNDMVARFGEQELIELTDRSSLCVIDSAVLAQALADADAEIDAYLTSRYTLPLASIPPVLTRVASDIARYSLYDVRAPDLVRTRYDDAIRFLVAVSNGKASLGLDAGSQPVVNSGGVQVSAGSRVFDSDSLSGY